MAAVYSEVQAELAVPPLALRAALGSFATGVTIVTACDPSGLVVGLTANSFNSVSLSPPLVLWSLGLGARSMTVFARATHYAINVLAADQRHLAERFASPVADRFAGVALRTGLGGCPLIEGAAASFECTSRSRYEEGDHAIFVGHVQRCVHHAGVPPLVFHEGRYVTGLPLSA